MRIFRACCTPTAAARPARQLQLRHRCRTQLCHSQRLIEAADEALLQAKRDGRNRIVAASQKRPAQ